MKNSNGKPENILALVSTAEPEKFVNIVQLSGRAIAIRESASKLVIQTDADESNAADALKEIKLIGSEAETIRKENVSPFNDLVKRINSFFKPITGDLEVAETSIKGKILTHRRYKEELRLAEERKRLEAYQKQVEAERKAAKKAKVADEYVPPPPPPAVLPSENTTRGQVGAATTRKVWKYRVLDISKVSPDLLIVDSSAVTARIRNILGNGLDPSNAIAGIEVYQEETVAVR